MKKFILCIFCGLIVHQSLLSQTMKWVYNLKDVSFGQTTACDLLGDGRMELIFSTYWNDSNVYCLNPDGSLRWKHLQKGSMGGCNDAGPLLFDPFMNGNYKVVVPGSCMDTTMCYDADSGYLQWKTVTGGGDSPPSCAIINSDGYPDVMHGTFYGNVKCLNGRTGALEWDCLVDTNAAIESEPTIIQNGGELDFACATWDFTTDSDRIACYRASDHSLKWKVYAKNLIYHGPATGDLFRDGNKEVVIGDYDGYLYCIRSSDGTLLWKDSTSKMLTYHYIGAPVTLADLDHDGYLDIVYMDGYMVRAVNRFDSTLWMYTPTSDYTNFRGCVAADVNGDSIPDITFCTNYGIVTSLDGRTGAVIRTFNIYNYAYTVLGDTSSIFEVDNAPIVADIDNDGQLELFIIAGKGRSDSTTWNDYGYAFCIAWGTGNGPAWTMFRHDERRTGCLCDSNGLPLSVPSVLVQPATITGIYPNPASGAFTVGFQLPVGESVKMELLDLTGRTILTTAPTLYPDGANHRTFTEAEIGDLPKGMYLLRLIGDDFNVTWKVMRD